MTNTSNVEAAFPLSPLQQGMLFHSLGAPGSAVYVIQIRCEVRGALQAEAFYQAWQRVLDRHQALRAAFVWEGMEEPLQVVGRRVRLPFRHCDLRGLPEAEQRRSLDAYARWDRGSGFTLSRGPLMRVVLADLGADRHEVVWTYHHIVCDGWSRPILLGEFWLCYEAFAARRSVELPTPRPFSHYIARLPRDLSASERFWRAQVGDVTHPTPLGVDQPAATRVAPEGYGQRTLRLSDEETSRLERWSRRQAVSLGTMLAGAWALVLSRYSRQDDVLFGVTVSGRSATLEGIESLVGLCINTLPLRVPVRPSEPVAGWLRALQARYAEVREHEHTPLSRIHKWSGVSPGQPLFESIVVFENFPVDAGLGPAGGVGPGLAIDNVRGFDKTNYALTLIAAPGREFLLMATYDPARLGEATVDALLGRMATVLRGFAARDGMTVGEVPLLGPEERAQIVTDWNATERAWPDAEASTSLVAWLEAQAAQTPESVAVWWEEGRLTYAELHAQANRIARRLRRLGVGAESRVAVWVERSPLLVASVVAVLKAGGAYVPLDPGYPAARLSFQCADAQVAVVLTTQAWAESVPAGPYAVEVLDAPDAAWREEEATAPAHSVCPEQLAYVIYTSGSTGQPKGAMNAHRGIANRLCVDAVRLRAGGRRPRAAEDLEQLRRVGVGAVLAAGDGGEPGAGAAGRPDRPALPGGSDRAGGRDGDALRPRHVRGVRVGGRAGLVGVGAADRVQRGSAARAAGGAVHRRLEGPAREPVRPDRSGGGRDVAALHAGDGGPAGGAHRPAGREHADLRARPDGGAGAGGSGGGALPGRRAGGPGLLEPPGAHGGALRAGPVRRRARRAPVSHRRPGALPVRRHGGVRGPGRSAGEAPREPDRAG